MLPLSRRFAFWTFTVPFHFSDWILVHIMCDPFRRHCILTSAIPSLVILIPCSRARSPSHILLLP